MKSYTLSVVVVRAENDESVSVVVDPRRVTRDGLLERTELAESHYGLLDGTHARPLRTDIEIRRYLTEHAAPRLFVVPRHDPGHTLSNGASHAKERLKRIELNAQRRIHHIGRSLCNRLARLQEPARPDGGRSPGAHPSPRGFRGGGN